MTTDKPSAGELREAIARIIDPAAKLGPLDGRWSSFEIQRRALAYSKADEILALSPPVAGAEVGVIKQAALERIIKLNPQTEGNRGCRCTCCEMRNIACAALVSSPPVAERADLAPTAWLVDGPLPLDSSEVFLIHEKALAAFNDWGKRITPLYAIQSTPPAAERGGGGAPASLTGIAIHEIARLIDGEAWMAIQDGRDALPDSMWSYRRDWALRKATAIANSLPDLYAISAPTPETGDGSETIGGGK